MTEAEKQILIENYVRAYNDFDVAGMLADLHDEIVFKNISGGETTHEIKGIKDFQKQAAVAAALFARREQKIKNFTCRGAQCEIEIDYSATLASDLPNGMKAGDEIEMPGKSIFRFADGKISEISDFS